MSKLTKFWLLAFLVAFPFGQLTRLPLGSPNVHLYLNDLILLLMLISWRGWKKNAWSKPPLIIPIWLFLGASLISVIHQPSALGFLYWLRLAAYCQLYWIIFDLKENFQLPLAAAGLAAAIFGLAQYALWPDLTAATIWGWDPHFFRATGPFLDPNFLGIILVLTLVLLFKNHLWLGLFVTYLVLALTYSRSSFLAFFAAVIAAKSLKIILLAIIAAVFTIMILPRSAGGEGVKLARTSTAWARWENYQQTFRLIRAEPIWGTGFQSRRVDNSLLFAWRNAGLGGLFALLYLLFRAFKASNGKFVALASLAAILTHAFAVNSLFYPWVLSWLMIILGSH